MKFTVIIAFFCLSILLLISQRTNATDCAISMEFEDATQKSKEIFMGRLVKIKTVKYLESESGPPTLFDSGWYQYELIFEVKKKWKGSNYNRVSLFIDSICPPYFIDNNKEREWLWVESSKKEFLNYHYIIYAVRDASRLEELVYRSTGKNSGNFNLPGYRVVSGSYFRTLRAKNPETDSLFISEIAKLDSTFTQPVTLVPYYFNLKNLLILIFLGILSLYVRKKFWISNRTNSLKT